MSVIAWIILGLIAGFIASQIVDREGKGLWLNMALGHRRRDCRRSDFQRLRGYRDHRCEPL